MCVSSHNSQYKIVLLYIWSVIKQPKCELSLVRSSPYAVQPVFKTGHCTGIKVRSGGKALIFFFRFQTHFCGLPRKTLLRVQAFILRNAPVIIIIKYWAFSRYPVVSKLRNFYYCEKVSETYVFLDAMITLHY